MVDFFSLPELIRCTESRQKAICRMTSTICRMTSRVIITEVSSIRSGLESHSSIWERDCRTATGHISPVKSAAAAA